MQNKKNFLGFKKLFLLLLLAACLSGCNMFDAMTDGFTHSNEVAADLEKTIGAKPQVGFNWQNGTLVEVSVTFDSFPQDRSFAQIRVAAKEAVAARFKQTPKQILISFRVED